MRPLPPHAASGRLGSPIPRVSIPTSPIPSVTADPDPPSSKWHGGPSDAPKKLHGNLLHRSGGLASASRRQFLLMAQADAGIDKPVLAFSLEWPQDRMPKNTAG